MFQLFLRGRARSFLSERAERRFQVRSAERDTETDRSRIGSIIAAIDDALKAAAREQVGLHRRVEEVLSRAAVTFGNGTDEYLEREPLDNHHQDLLAAEIANGQRRLNELETTISHLNFVKSTMLTRFPHFTLPREV